MTQSAKGFNTLRQRAEDAGQGHVFRFWDRLSEAGREQLLGQVAEVDFEELAELVEELVLSESAYKLPPDMEPAPFVPRPSSDAQRRERAEMQRRGEALIAAGRVAAFVVAGGQGTRLGYDGPKGAFPVGPISEKPLFAIFAEGILAARRASGASIPWYIMTSRTNHQATVDFFEAHNYFDLPRSDVRFFRQGMMPAVDFEGKLILADTDRLFWSPDGHGGSLRALVRTGMTDDMAARGIDHVSYFQVDNPLVPPLDPVFLGYHDETGSEMSSKMARKRDPRERLGHFVVSEGRLHVVEYSDMPADLARKRTEDGRLQFEAGSIAIHALRREFVERIGGGKRFGLPFHRADKTIPRVNEDGEVHEPKAPNGVKFETFVFDALPRAQNPLVLEIDRAKEFSPVKNAEGEDSPATARRDMIRLDAARLEEVGVEVPRDPSGDPVHAVEISPLAAHDRPALEEEIARRGIRRVTEDLYLGPEL